MINDLDKLLDEKCRDIPKSEGSLNLSDIQQLRALVPEWEFEACEKHLNRTLHFNNYSDTIAAVSRIASIAEDNNHHPEMIVSYRRCKIIFSTHTVNGVTINDFICAAKIDKNLGDK